MRRAVFQIIHCKRTYSCKLYKTRWGYCKGSGSSLWIEGPEASVSLILQKIHFCLRDNQDCLFHPCCSTLWDKGEDRRLSFCSHSLTLECFLLGISLVVQWLRICLLMQGKQVRSLVKELRYHNSWVHAPWSPHITAHGHQRGSWVPHGRPDSAKEINTHCPFPLASSFHFLPHCLCWGFLSLYLKMRLEIILTALRLYDRGLEDLGGMRKETK